MIRLRDLVEDKGVLLLIGNPRWLLKILVDKWSREKKVIIFGKLIISPQHPKNVIIHSDIPSSTTDIYPTVIEGYFDRKDIEKERILTFISNNYRKAPVIIYEEKYYFKRAFKSKLCHYLSYIAAYKRETVNFDKIEIFKLENCKIINRSIYIRRL
ncbi:hypothetical protein PFDSM3638_09205 [Pyrococcus furiosus DSM 3638]|uniref:Uncharacterized protein n=2 Tax=Pyrococcus furiosus (strain ATCC 43587 / DSM 3638 / JCM 8422 / Vc1) TaxID=186497 RepID=A0A5C0XRP4_PYRFU|nr:hypothetical protein [Pyrococcus furiosus]AAL81954.1 putative regulatory protein [Pyrococcus furiosus DSM 3638]QEK79432.1 hypothetical protein PFDSM3638_09205 [Pyrococcus furiosus DSM 3638]